VVIPTAGDFPPFCPYRPLVGLVQRNVVAMSVLSETVASSYRNGDCLAAEEQGRRLASKYELFFGEW
jgi:hypothetical protein